MYLLVIVAAFVLRSSVANAQLVTVPSGYCESGEGDGGNDISDDSYSVETTMCYVAGDVSLQVDWSYTGDVNDDYGIYGVGAELTAYASYNNGNPQTVLADTGAVDGEADLNTGGLVSSSGFIYVAGFLVEYNSADYSSYSNMLSDTYQVSVGATATSTTLTTSGTPIAYGQTATLTATVSPSNGSTGALPTGTVTFYYTYNNWLSGTDTEPIDTSSGFATATSTIGSSASVGSYSVTAEYDGDATYGESASNTIVQVVSAVTTCTIVWPTPAAIPYGTALSATQLNAKATCNGTTIGGTFVYTPAAGTVLAIGSQALSVTFTPYDQSYTTVTATVHLTILALQTISFSPPPSFVTYGVAPITLSASASSGLPVTFRVYSGPAAVSGTDGSTLTINGAGAVLVAANQSGNGYYSAAPQVLQLVWVNVVPTVTEISSSANPIIYGGSTTFTALVVTGGMDPTGSVTFTSNGALIGSGTVSTVTTTNLVPDSQGFTGWTGSGVTAQQSSIWGPNGISGNAESLPFGSTTGTYAEFDYWGFTGSYAGESLTLSAWMTADTPTTIQLFIAGNQSGDYAVESDCVLNPMVWQRCSVTGTIPSTQTNGLYLSIRSWNQPTADTVYVWGPQFEVGTFAGPYIATSGTAATGSSGVATLTTTSLLGGSDSIVATYSGNTNIQSTASNPLVETVTQITPTLSWATPAAITYGTALSATQLNATATYNGATVPGTFTYTPAAGTVLSAGAQTLSVTFTPNDSIDYASPQPATVSLLVNKVTPTLSLTTSAPGNPVTLTATISPTGATGTVTFLVDGSSIGSATISGNTATLATGVLTAGTYTFSASYSGDTNYSATDSTLTQAVTADEPSPSSGINPNDTYAVFDVTVQSAGGTYQYNTNSSGGPGTASLPATVAFPHYHVEMGYDTSDNFVANITPTDPSGLTGFQAADFVSSIQIRGNTVTLLDGNGAPIQVQPLLPGAIIPGIIQAHVTASQSLNAALAPQSLSAFASATGGSLTQNGTAVSIQNSKGASILQYATSGGNTTLASITTTRTSPSFGSVTDTTTFSNMVALTNPAGDARRAANAPPVAPNPSAPAVASSCAVQDSSYPVIGPGPGTNLTMVHGLTGSGGSTGSFKEMEPWIAGDMQVGSIALPDVGWSNGLNTQVNNLISQVSGPSILIGHSQGGLVVRRFGQLMPNLTQGIITIDTPHQGAAIAFTGPAALASAVGYGLSYACISPTHFEACALSAAILGAGTLVTWDLAMPAFRDLYPGSSFLSTLNNSADPAVTRVGIVSHSNPRFVLLRVLGDANPACNPQDWCGGRAWYTTGQVVYYSAIGSLVLDAVFSWLDPELVFDASISIDVILVMDGADLAWKVVTAAPGDTDGVVPGYSQTYPNASATYTIANADSHLGNLKSTYVRDTLEDVLAQQFAIPAIGCIYGLGTQYGPDPVFPHIPFYGGTDFINAVAYGVSNPNLCPIQGVSNVPFAQTGPLAVGSLQYNYAVGFNFSKQPRSGVWWNFEGQNAGAYQDPMPQRVALGSLMITGQDQYEVESGPPDFFGWRDVIGEYDNGTVTLTVNNVAYSVPYNVSTPSGCNTSSCVIIPTPASIMTALVNKINAGSQYVNAVYSNCAITIVAWDQSAMTTDYDMSISIQSNLPNSNGDVYFPAFPNPSFTGVLSGPTLTGNP
jgi:pimeloyl-ACP methyl ester carboxylesterase